MQHRVRVRVTYFCYFVTRLLHLDLFSKKKMLKREYEVEMAARHFCMENFANLKRYNKQSSSSNSLHIFHSFAKILFSQTFNCISGRLLNVTTGFVHLQIIVWGGTKDSGNIFSGQAAAWDSTKDIIVLC